MENSPIAVDLPDLANPMKSTISRFAQPFGTATYRAEGVQL